MAASPCRAPGAGQEAAGRDHGPLRGSVSVVVPESDAEEDLSAPLAAASPEEARAVFQCSTSTSRRVSRGCWSLGLLATGLAGAALLPSAKLLLRRGAGPATSERVTTEEEALSLYVNLSAVHLGQAGKPSEYLLLKGPDDHPNEVAVQVKQGECALDIIQAAQYFGRAGLQITQSVKTCKPIYNSYGSDKYAGNDYIRTACAADASGIFSSFGFAATYLSLSASHCSQTVNLPAVCASSATGLIAALAKVSVEATTMAANCEGGVVFSNKVPPAEVGSDAVWQNDRRLQPSNQSLDEQINEANAALQDTWAALGQLNESINAAGNVSDPAYEDELRMERDGEMTTCIIDATQAATYLAQFGVAIQKAAKGCPLQQEFANVQGVEEINNRICAGSILEIIGGIMNTGAFVASAVSHCALGINTQALCSQGAVGLVAAVAELGNFLQAMNSACEVFPPILDHLAATSGHTMTHR